MSTIIEATIPAEQFALSETLDRVPEAEFEVLRMVAHRTDGVLPFLWAGGRDVETVHDALVTDSSVERVEALTELDQECLYRMEWVGDIRIMVHIMLEEQATVLGAYGTDAEWYLRILFPERESLSTTQQFCEEFDIGLDVQSIYDLSNSMRHGQFGLTEEQYDALAATLEHGFYDIPRGMTLEEVGEELDISHQALSERLRRGHKKLVQHAIRAGPASEMRP